MEVSAFQLRAARGLVNWSQRELARKLNISSAMMNYHEKGLRVPSERMKEILSLFENEGISFVETEQSRGVMQQKRHNELGN